MCMPVLGGGIPVLADDGGEARAVPVINRKLSVEFMGRGDTPSNESQGSAKLTSNDVGNEFWVGVAVDKVNDLDLFTDGIYSLEVGFEYDPEYIEPYRSTANADDDWQTALTAGNLSTSNSSVNWNQDQYELISVRSTSIDTVNDRENSSIARQRAENGWKMCTVGVTFKGTDFSNARFKGLTEDTTQYLLRLPFKLLKAPTESSSDLNPKVLSLVRGPETLDIGSGEDGTSPYSQWQATVTDWNDTQNMKTLFRDGGDISLFGTGDSISDIVAVKTKSGDETEDTQYTLSRTDLLQEEGFESATEEYYLSVPNETDKIKLNITSSETPTVIANGDEVTATLDNNLQAYVTDEFDLSELDKTIESNGFNNTVTVKAGDTTYTIHIRRLLKPKIVLNYGNSPVGMIMGDNDKYPTIDDKNSAIDNFKTKHIFSDVTANLVYYTEAWSSYKAESDEDEDYNGDLDPTAIFIFQRKKFKDPGFTAYDSLGNDVTDTVKSSLTITSFKGGAVPTYSDSDSPVDITEEATGNEHIYVNYQKVNMRPDVYELNYQFEDSFTTKIVTSQRKVIAISQLGDARIDANNIVNNLDASLVKGNSIIINKSNSLYKFRVCDARIDANKIVNNLDASLIKGSSTKLSKFYKELPSE